MTALIALVACDIELFDLRMPRNPEETEEDTDADTDVGTIDTAAPPPHLPPDQPWDHLALGHEHGCAWYTSNEGGGVYCFGNPDKRPTPDDAKALRPEWVAVGPIDTCVRTTDDAVLCYGPDWAELETAIEALPSELTHISIGGQAVCGIDTSQMLSCAGWQPSARPAPEYPEGASRVAGAADYFCALTVDVQGTDGGLDGRWKCWGDDAHDKFPADPNPYAADTYTWTSIRVTNSHACAIGTDYAVDVDGATVVHCEPEEDFTGFLPNESQVLDAAAAGTFGCARTEDLQVFCTDGVDNIVGEGAVALAISPYAEWGCVVRYEPPDLTEKRVLECAGPDAPMEAE